MCKDSEFLAMKTISRPETDAPIILTKPLF